MRAFWIIPLVPLLACTGGPGDDEVGETANSADSSDSSETANSTDSTTTDSTTTDSTTTDSTDSTTGADSCPPLPESPADFAYTIEIPGADPWDTDITWSCTVIDSNTLDGFAVTLDCPEAMEPVVVSVLADPLLSPPVMNGAAMTLRYVSEGPWWFNSYLRLDLDGFGHLLTLIDGDALQPPDPFVFELPVPISTVSGLCDPVPDGCGERERLGLAFTVNGEDVVMFDPNFATVGGIPGTDVWVAAAGHLHDVLCTDTPDEWFRVLIANTGWE